MGSGWKGKAGAISGMIAALAGVLRDFSTGEVTVEKLIAYWAAFSIGFSMFGTRQALDGVVLNNPKPK